jgi:hypothetical protein
MSEDALYLLKLRRDRPGRSSAQWRVTLENVRDHGRWNFASLEACFAFLSERCAISTSSEDVPLEGSSDVEL